MRRPTYSIAIAVLVMAAALSGCVHSSATPPALTSLDRASARPDDIIYSDFLYVNAGCGIPPESGICIFAFPSGEYVGWVDDYTGSTPFGLCSDAQGHVFVTSILSGNDGAVLEYGHNGNGPIAILKDGHHSPNACGVDQAGANLAVANLSSDGVPGNVAVYTNAQGKPAFRRATGIFNYDFCGYDNMGNLYVTGTSKSGTVSLAKLPSGETRFVDVTLDKPLVAPGPIQWDGKHLAVGYGDLKGSLIYRVDVTGNKGTVVATTQLSAPKAMHPAMGPFWIQDTEIVASYKAEGHFPVAIWNYPDGGTPKKVIRRGRRVSSQGSLTVSVMPTL